MSHTTGEGQIDVAKSWRRKFCCINEYSIHFCDFKYSQLVILNTNFLRKMLFYEFSVSFGNLCV